MSGTEFYTLGDGYRGDQGLWKRCCANMMIPSSYMGFLARQCSYAYGMEWNEIIRSIVI